MTARNQSGRIVASSESRPGSAPKMGVMIGRFQFFHHGHMDAIAQGLDRVERLALMVGSANKPRTYFNPFTYEERRATILDSLPPHLSERVTILPLEDSSYNNTQWVSNVHDRAGQALGLTGLPSDTEIGLVGLKKDGTSYYLNMFPRWQEISVENVTGLSATPLREEYFLNDNIPRGKMPVGTEAFLQDFRRHSGYDRLVDEYRFIEEYRAPYKALPYPPTFVTVDACVVQAGYVLLVQRRAMPGKGLWALPGGFLESTARIEDWVYQELYQETRIKIPEEILRARTETIRVYDDVHRSARGRTITHCALITLDPSPRSRKSPGRVPLPRVRGADDAEKARWFPLKGPGSINPAEMFEDHYSIIQDLTAGL